MRVLAFSYDWYYTANFEIKFTGRPIYQYDKGQIAPVELTFDDSDGARANSEHFNCLKLN